jgi:hypothetical protein
MGGGLTTLDGGGALHEFTPGNDGMIIIPPGPGTGNLTGKALVEDLTILSAPFTDTIGPALIPVNAVVMAVATKVLTAIPGAATFDVGDPILPFRFATLVGTAVGNEHPGTRSASARWYGVQTAIRVTPIAIPPAPTGVVRVTLYYYEVVPG